MFEYKHETANIFLIVFLVLLLFPLSVVNAQGNRNEWTTERTVSPVMTLRYHWTARNEGFESVTLIEAIRNHQIVKTLPMTGQPVFNSEITRAAFPDCWNGGCSSKIRILDLSTLSELSPIQFEKESFLAVSWENEKSLKVDRAPLNREGKTEAKSFKVN